MILAAGRGERMRPLTDHLPKPLLKIGGKALIEYHLLNLAQAGFQEVIINHAYLGEMIESTLGDGTRYGIKIRYSPEKKVLETAGGIANALPLLSDETNRYPFLVVNGDIYCELDYAVLGQLLRTMHAQGSQQLAHLILVDNPEHHAEGDFELIDGMVCLAKNHSLTFSGMGLYQAELFARVPPGIPAKLAPILRQAMQQKRVSGEYFSGRWVDVGTPERLAKLDQQLTS